MTGLLLDTHALLWTLDDNPKLSATARTEIQSSHRSGQNLWFSSISLAEVVYLQEKSRISVASLSMIYDEVNDPNSAYREVPITAAIVRQMQLIPRDDVPDLPDRLIAATALYLGLPLITADGKIRSLISIRTIW